MKKWESKCLPTGEEPLMAIAQAAFGTRAGKVKMEGASILVGGAGIATLQAGLPAKEGDSGRTVQRDPIEGVGKQELHHAAECFHLIMPVHYCHESFPCDTRLKYLDCYITL